MLMARRSSRAVGFSGSRKATTQEVRMVSLRHACRNSQEFQGLRITTRGEMPSHPPGKPSRELRTSHGRRVSPSRELRTSHGRRVSPTAELRSSHGRNVSSSAGLQPLPGRRVSPSAELQPLPGRRVSPTAELRTPHDRRMTSAALRSDSLRHVTRDRRWLGLVGRTVAVRARGCEVRRHPVERAWEELLHVAFQPVDLSVHVVDKQHHRGLLPSR